MANTICSTCDSDYKVCVHGRLIASQNEAARLRVALVREHAAATGHLRPGEFGVIDPNRYAAMGCKTCAALVLEAPQ